MNMISRLFLFLSISLFSFPTFSFDTSEQASTKTLNRLIKEGKNKEAIEFSEKEIEKGSKNTDLIIFAAKANIHGLYEHSRNVSIGIELLQEGIRLQDKVAAFTLGSLQVHGNFVHQNCREGLANINLAIKLGSLNAEAYLANMYYHGLCVPIDKTLARQLIEHPASQKEIFALSILGNMYFFGDGEKQDYAKAFKLYIEAASLGDCTAIHALGAMYDNGIYVDIDAKMAFKYFSKGANGGCIESQVALGGIYYRGEYIQQDDEKAFQLFYQAFQKGDLEAQSYVGVFYFHGVGVTQNKTLGLQLLRGAAEQGNDRAQTILANLYFEGDDIEQNFTESANLFRQSFEAGDPFAAAYLALQYEYGLGVDLNLTQAESFYLSALKQGNILARYSIARWYIHGKYYAKDHKEALHIIEDGLDSSLDEIAAEFVILLSCSSDSDVRDSKRAISFVSKRTQDIDNESFKIIIAMAAAYADQGEFERANKIINKASMKEYVEKNRFLLSLDENFNYQNLVESFNHRQKCYL